MTSWQNNQAPISKVAFNEPVSEIFGFRVFENVGGIIGSESDVLRFAGEQIGMVA